MSIRSVCRAIGLAASLMGMQDGAAQPYVGLGFASFSLGSQYSSIDGRSGSGFTLLGGFEFASGWSTEMSVSAATGIDTGPTQNIYYPADSAEYSILRFSVRKSLWALAERKWAPWIAAGTAYHYINWDTFYYQLDGVGLSLGAGVDFELAPSWRLRVQGTKHRFSVRDTYGDGPYSSRSSELSAAAIFAFR